MFSYEPRNINLLHGILQLGAVKNGTGNDLSAGTAAYSYAGKAICVPPDYVFQSLSFPCLT